MPLDRLSALESPYSITKTIFWRAVYAQSSSSWTPLVSSFTTKPYHQQEDSFYSPPSPASYLFIFCLISILKSSLQLVFHLIESEAKTQKSVFLQKYFFFLSLNSFKHLDCYRSITMASYIYHNFILCLHCYCNSTSFPSSNLLYLVFHLVLLVLM